MQEENTSIKKGVQSKEQSVLPIKQTRLQRITSGVQRIFRRDGARSALAELANDRTPDPVISDIPTPVETKIEVPPIEGRKTDHIAADAMLYGQAMLLKEAKIDGRTLKETPLAERQVFIERATDQLCGEATTKALEYFCRFPNDFDTLVVINGKQFVDEEVRDFKDGPFNDHYRFLVRGKPAADDEEPMWYSGSPANYKRRKEGQTESTSPITRLNKSTNLNELMHEIQEQDGGIWPTTELIEDTISQPTFKNPHTVTAWGAKEFLACNIDPKKAFNKTMSIEYPQTETQAA